VDLSGWKTADPGTWKVNDWTLESSTNASPLWTERDFKRCHVIVDWRFPSGRGESAIYISGRTNKLTATDTQWHRMNFYDPVSSGPIGLGGGGAHFANIYVKEMTGPPK